MENNYWKKTVGMLITGIWVYTLADIFGNVLDIIENLLNPMDLKEYFEFLARKVACVAYSGNVWDVIEIEATDVLGVLCNILVFVGYYLFYKSLLQFVKMQTHVFDRFFAQKVKSAYVLFLVATVVDFIPLVGNVVKLILLIIAYVKLLYGYRGWSDSQTWTYGARQGAALLHKAVIWGFVAGIIGVIPIIGAPIEAIVEFILFFTILNGWKQIQQGAPVLTEEENKRLSIELSAI